MRRSVAKFFWAILFFPLFGFSNPATAASVTAHASATDVHLSDTLTLTLDIADVANVGGTPSLQIPGFRVEPAGRTVSTQWVNGQISSLVSFLFVLSPTRTGTINIPSLTLSVSGQSYSTQPIMINVRPDGAAAATGGAPANDHPGDVSVPTEGLKPAFMTAKVDAERAYVGQQILLRVQFLHRPDVQFTSQPSYTEPDMTGFVVEPLQRQEYTTVLNGTSYQVVELPYALFPTSDGDFVVGGAHLEIAVRSNPDPMDPNSFFQSFFGHSDVMRLTTRPISISVRALPKNKPAAFSGAVGRYRISGRVDTDQPEVGKPFNLILTVEGAGNIKALKEPATPELRGFRRYETISNSKVSNDGKFLHGSKEFKILLIPQVSGQLTIPAIPFVYFNPGDGEYVTDSTPEIPLSVKVGQVGNTEPDTTLQPAAADSQPTEGVRVMEKDIRFLKEGSIRPAQPPLYLRGSFILLNVLPPLFALVAFLVRWQSNQRRENAEHFRARGALRNALRTLSVARKKMGIENPVPFYEALHAALANFLADKLGVAAAGLVWEDVEQRLRQRNADPLLCGRVRALLDEADMARFAPSALGEQSRTTALAQAQETLKALNEVLK